MTEMGSRAIVLSIDGAVRPADVVPLCNLIGARLLRSEARLVVVDVASLRADVSGVDVLARLALTARRLGMSVTLRNAGTELRALLCLVGVAGSLSLELELATEPEQDGREHRVDDRGASRGLEPIRKPEQPEQAGHVEKERDLGDLAG